MRYIIIGGGIAGTTAAEELRKGEPDAEITLIGEEHEILYSRVLLPRYAKGLMPREKVFLKKETWYAEKNIEWLTGTRCDAIDVVNKHVAISDGRELPFDKLLIATGGEVRTLPYEGENVCYFHSLGDTEHLIALMRSHADGRGIVYGGSFIAAELLDIFLHHKLPTVAAFRGPWMFHRILDEQSGGLVSDHLQSAGVQLRPGCDTLEAVGATEKDVVGLGIGVEPDLAWIRDAGIAVNKGVVTNPRLATNMPDVFAAGDVAEFEDLVVGRTLMAGNWPSAVMQGRVAAHNMAGKSEEFRNVSAYATNLAGLDIIGIGDTDRAFADEVLVVGSREAGGITQLFVRGKKVVGATLVNRNADRTAITGGIRNGLAPADIKLS